MVTLAKRFGRAAVRTPSMVTAMRFKGTFVSFACASMRVTPQDDTPARKASLLVRVSAWGLEDESRVRRAFRAWLTARPTVPMLEERMLSTLSVLMLDPSPVCAEHSA